MHYRKPTAALAAVLSLALSAPSNADAAQRACLEDAPCWTWSTMGNRSRGIVTTSGRKLVVRPGRFARLDAAKRIDWTATPKLRGDHTARRAGCSS